MFNNYTQNLFIIFNLLYSCKNQTGLEVICGANNQADTIQSLETRYSKLLVIQNVIETNVGE